MIEILSPKKTQSWVVRSDETIFRKTHNSNSISALRPRIPFRPCSVRLPHCFDQMLLQYQDHDNFIVTIVADILDAPYRYLEKKEIHKIETTGQEIPFTDSLVE
jgi:hypothetical protein